MQKLPYSLNEFRYYYGVPLSIIALTACKATLRYISASVGALYIKNGCNSQSSTYLSSYSSFYMKWNTSNRNASCLNQDVYR